MSVFKSENFSFRIAFSFLLLILPVGIGLAGYMLIEKYGFLDALYMSVITIATVGYGEVIPLSDNGRIFTIFLIITNLGVFAYALSLITSILIQGEFYRKFKKNMMKNKISKLRNHVIVCGYGRNGKEAVAILIRKKIPFVVIERNKEVASTHLEGSEFLFLNEDAIVDEILLEAQIEHARGLISTLSDDADNVYVVLTARELNQKMVIVSRASKDATVKKLKRAGANNVIMPDKIGGAHMASLIIQPDVKEFLDIISGQGENVQLEEFDFGKIKERFNGLTIAELNLRHITGVNVIGLKLPNGNYTVNPDIFVPLESNVKLIVLGTSQQMDLLKSKLDYQ